VDSLAGGMPSYMPEKVRIPPQGGAAPISAPSIDSRDTDAKAAGASFGSAFRQGAMEEINGALAEVYSAIDKMIAKMTFGVSPNITPSGGDVWTSGAGGVNANGIFSDPGVAPLR
jgi:hypothetical protein